MRLSDVKRLIREALRVDELGTFGFSPPNVPNYEGNDAEDDVVNVNAITDHDLEKEIADNYNEKHRDDIEEAIRANVRQILTEQIDGVIDEWTSKNRRLGCVAATRWFCSRVKGFYPVRIDRYTKNGELYGHVVASNGRVNIDLAPDQDLPSEFNSEQDGNLAPRKITFKRDGSEHGVK